MGLLFRKHANLLWVFLMAGLIVRKQDGNVLLDTNYITHGLVKSGYLQADEGWSRYVIKGINVDPNLGTSWNPTSVLELMFSITVPNAQSPICFIVGPGYLQGSTRIGSSVKFIFAGASASTKAYVFDLMGDNIAGSPPWLKCRNQQGAVTFNSLQVPLNIAGNPQAPGPGPLDRFSRYTTAYNGGVWNVVQDANASRLAIRTNTVDIAFSAGVEYAASITFTRACRGYWTNVNGGQFDVGMSEGAYGRVGGITWIFGPAGGTTQGAGGSYTAEPSAYNLPTDRYPTALVITTGNLPFPFN
jgi:hypothetical protein